MKIKRAQQLFYLFQTFILLFSTVIFCHVFLSLIRTSAGFCPIQAKIWQNQLKTRSCTETEGLITWQKKYSFESVSVFSIWVWKRWCRFLLEKHRGAALGFSSSLLLELSGFTLSEHVYCHRWVISNQFDLWVWPAVPQKLHPGVRF